MSRAEQEARRAETSRPMQVLGRLGMSGYGVVHLLIAWLAVQTAFGGGGEADQKGAVSTLAAQPFGAVLLWILAVALVGFGLWQLLAAAVGYRWMQDEKQRLRRRLGVAGRGVVVLAIAAYAIKLTVGGGGSSGNQSEQDATAKLLQLPAGQALVIAAGVAICVAAGVLGYRGVSRKFLEDLNVGLLPPGARKAVLVSGIVGYVTKGVAYMIIGVLTVVAAATADPHRTGGLDKALHTVAGQPFGPALLTAVAVGFAAFGVFCFGDARCRRM
ncbi:DUF1206 domain-containing protein [Kutzneria buriramensis]|uniref:Uncharacterized protein DUF1206 n=1 Tax=Kutzneria buriramensis TaxID=1045776 RepID=A0A3E0I6P8_9PSEU|nr:DUF1206 domain-containing protein [Kutzneria buriramensis]REH54424.1 uncharacterized protein DUF1206 [Kutzneria buriramensis]